MKSDYLSEDIRHHYHNGNINMANIIFDIVFFFDDQPIIDYDLYARTRERTYLYCSGYDRTA